MSRETHMQKLKGILRNISTEDNLDGFQTRMLLQMGEIRDFIYKDSAQRTFDDKLNPVYQNLLEARLVKNKCLQLIDNYSERLNRVAQYDGNSIIVSETIDDELNLYLKDFFIRGRIAFDNLEELAQFLGFDIKFIFDSEDNFLRGIERFRTTHKSGMTEFLVQMISSEREKWFETFVKMRIEIEHKGFKFPDVDYQLKGKKVEAILPKLLGQEIHEGLELLWKNVFTFCEDVIVMLLSTKLPQGFAIMHIPEKDRDKALPIKYKVSFFPTEGLRKITHDEIEGKGG